MPTVLFLFLSAELKDNSCRKSEVVLVSAPGRIHKLVIKLSGTNRKVL